MKRHVAPECTLEEFDAKMRVIAERIRFEPAEPSALVGLRRTAVLEACYRSAAEGNVRRISASSVGYSAPKVTTGWCRRPGTRAPCPTAHTRCGSRHGTRPATSASRIR